MPKIYKDKDGIKEFVTLFETIYPGPFYTDPFEVESCKFYNMKKIANDKRLTDTTKLYIKEYMERNSKKSL